MAKAAYIGVSTDVLCKAIDTDGSVYNGIGYVRSGKRINSSDGAILDESEYGCTGFIPVRPGSTIYTKDIDIDVSDGWACVVLYNSSFARIMSVNAKNLTTNAQYYYTDSYAKTETGFQVRVANTGSNANVAYIRLTCNKDYIGANPMISVDEPIGSFARSVKSMYVGVPGQSYTLTLPAGRMRGDVNGDGEVDVTDSDLIRAHSVNVSILTDPIQLWCADCNNSGTINVTDALQASQVGGGTRLLGSLGNDYTGNYTVNPNYETEAGQFYTDIAVSNLPNSNNITILDDAGLVTKVERNGSSIRAYVSKCPIANKNFSIHIAIPNQNLPSVARKVKNAWIGVNGVARLLYSNE